jgi:hypothetical protein
MKHTTMKNMTKMMAVAIAAIAIFFTTQVKAQTTDPNKWRLGIGAEGGIPTGDVSTGYKFDLGGTARLQYGLSKNVALTLTSGYYNFFATQAEKDEGGKSFGMVPVKAGAKIFFDSPIYFGAEAGAGFQTGPASTTRLLLSPGLGWANKSWDIGARYENFSSQGINFGTVALRVAYGFSL